MKMQYRRLTEIVLIMALVLNTNVLAQTTDQKLITNPVKIVSPYPPGGTTDILARLIAPKLQEELGQSVFVENRGGASSNIGNEYVVRSNPDGCTLLLGNNTGVVINQNLYKLNFVPSEDLVPVIMVAAVPLVLFVHPSVPAHTVSELVNLVKKNPGKYEYASGGSGSPQHLSGEMLKLAYGLDLLHVPYKGQAPSTADVVAGHIPMAFETTAVLLPFIESNRVRPLATTGPTRSITLPNVPTMIESGLPGFVVTNWYGVFAPKGTPRDIVDMLNSKLQKILSSADVKERLAKMGSASVHGSAEDFSKFIKEEVPRWADVVKRSGARVD